MNHLGQKLLSLMEHTRGEHSVRDNFFIYFLDLLIYDAFAMGIFAAFSIFSAKIPYPLVGSLTKTWVTAPTSLPLCKIGEPLGSDVNMGQ